MGQLWHDIGVSRAGAVAVVTSTVVMYAMFALVLHMWGHRLRSSSSSVTMALAALVGSIAARSTLGNYPTLTGGLLAIGTLLVLERVFGVLVRAARHARPHLPHAGRSRHPRSDGPSDRSGQAHRP